ncbi:MAG: DUF4292 domain-containing protein [Flavobacteriaceae bacterium]|nr:DUF4292 domain-containing protein [Flavobacteriaceae bacterium]
MLKRILYILIITISVVSCRSSKVTDANTNLGMSAKKVIKNHYNNAFNKETITAKLKVKYIGKSNLPGVTASLRVKKDETIWISLSKFGFPVGKALITPNRVTYYEKINRTYFDGDFSLLSNWLGTELDFEKIQNLLLGQAILNLKDEKYLIDLQKDKYQLTPKKEYGLFSILFLINPDNFKINSQEISQKEENKTLIIDYNNYTKVDDEVFPKEIYITASDAKNTSTIDVNYKSVVFNSPVSFPFKIPKHYKRIVLD